MRRQGRLSAGSARWLLASHHAARQVGTSLRVRIVPQEREGITGFIPSNLAFWKDLGVHLEAEASLGASPFIPGRFRSGCWGEWQPACHVPCPHPPGNPFPSWTRELVPSEGETLACCCPILGDAFLPLGVGRPLTKLVAASGPPSLPATGEPCVMGGLTVLPPSRSRALC